MTKPDSLKVFERTNGWKFTELTFSPQNLRVLALIDGKLRVADICDALELTDADIRKDLEFLENHNLIMVKTEMDHRASQSDLRTFANSHISNSTSADL